MELKAIVLNLREAQYERTHVGFMHHSLTIAKENYHQNKIKWLAVSVERPASLI